MIKALETSYDGHVFRSLLEARWAVFFNHIGIEYLYEYEGYDLGGVWYLPDFFIPPLDVWIEIKGPPPTSEEDDLMEKLTIKTGKDGYIFFGDIPFPEPGHGCYTDVNESANKFFRDEGWDNCHTWCECPLCGTMGIHYMGYAERLHCKCDKGTIGVNANSERLMAAYSAARSYRPNRE